MKLHGKTFMFGIVTLIGLASSSIASAEAEKGSYKIDPVHSQALFTVGHLGVSKITGRFDSVKGELTVDGTGGAVKAEIDIASVDTNFADRDKHLRSPDFFDAVQFPKMTFESTAVSVPATGEGTMTGNLTMHGVTKPVTFKLSHIGAGKGPMGYRSGYVATTMVRRSDFGMKFLIGMLTDDIEVRINIEAVKQ